MNFLHRSLLKQKIKAPWPSAYVYDPSSDEMAPQLDTPSDANIGGPFYVTDQCIICGLPPETAQENIAYHPSCERPSNCRLFKQPDNTLELEQVIEAMACSCVEAIRYRGTDPVILQRLKNLRLSHLCDSSIP